MAKRYWRIKSEDVSKPFETFVPANSLSDREVRILLQRLVCMSLDSEEILASSLRRSAKNFQEHLEVMPIDAGTGGGWMAGGASAWTARIVVRE
jgi:hypothetical protein